jgi:hypothetical protein
METLWRVRWQFRDRSGFGRSMTRDQAIQNAARSNAIDPAIVHWAEPLPDGDRAAAQHSHAAISHS